MPKNKDLKRLIRVRMKKTGESYTAARVQLTAKKKRAVANPVPDDRYAELAGMSDDAVRSKTGKTWKQWVGVLDAVDASGIPHRDIARHIHEDYDIPGWWAQTVTVGYERIRGLREVGQRRGGSYEANKSKTVPVPIAKLYRAFGTARARRRWLPDIEIKVRTATPEKSMRITWPDGTSVHVYFTAKGNEKSQVAVQHAKLTRKADATKMKAFWGERLEALAGLLARRR